MKANRFSLSVIESMFFLISDLILSFIQGGPRSSHIIFRIKLKKIFSIWFNFQSAHTPSYKFLQSKFSIEQLYNSVPALL